MLILARAILSAVSPMAAELCLASMHRLAGYFQTSASAVQLTLTICMVGMACGQFLEPVSTCWAGTG